MGGFAPGMPNRRAKRREAAVELARGGDQHQDGLHALQHAAFSERVLDRTARSFVAQLAEIAPAFLITDPSYAPAVQAWARSEARVVHLTRYVNTLHSVSESLTEVVSTDETVTADPSGSSRRISISRRLSAAEESLRRAELLAARLRADLGLTPLSRARFGADWAQAARWDLAQVWALMGEQEERKTDE